MRNYIKKCILILFVDDTTKTIPSMSKALSHLVALLRFAVIVLVVAACTPQPETYQTWSAFGGDPTNSQYSSLDQINKSNAEQLQVAWTYNTGDHNTEGSSQIQTNPLVVGSVLYGVSPQLKLFAVDAATGTEQWVFDPYAQEGTKSVFGVSRGLAYWEDGEDQRILLGAGAYVYAVDAATGASIETFGNEGRIDLREELDRDVTGLFWSLNTPGVVYKDLYIVGGRVAEEQPSAPGHIRAYNIRTGERAWIFHTIPHPGEYGYETWPEDGWGRLGGANSWAGMSLDEERGIVYVPTGSAAFDFWGGNRHGENLFANSIVALNAETGERVWHYQTIRHDIWDRDLPAAPNLLTLNRDGRTVDAVAQVTKSGHVFVLDRDTGESLFPIDEVEVPASELDGEAAWPTQPLPRVPKPFARQHLTLDDISTVNPQYTEMLQDSLRGLRSEGQFVPPSEDGIIIYPGFDGGAEWGGAAHDPNTGVLYVNSNEMAWVQHMRRLDTDDSRQMFSSGQSMYFYYCAACHGFGQEGAAGFPALTGIQDRKTREEIKTVIQSGGGRMPGFGYLKQEEIDVIIGYLYGEEDTDGPALVPGAEVLYTHQGYNRFFDPEGYPAIQPPWGTLSAIDLNTGEYLWTKPLGEFPELTERGIPQTGTENYGGPVVTAGGIIFIGASKDEHFRVFDKDTGEELWKTKLPAGGYATPATYEVNGKQYVVIAAGGGKMDTKSGDAYVAFALP